MANELSAIKVPTLLVWGLNDTITRHWWHMILTG
jgi:pimeloyl-ACP methyl ester carboxylesterase